MLLGLSTRKIEHLITMVTLSNPGFPDKGSGAHETEDLVKFTLASLMPTGADQYRPSMPVVC